MAGGQVGFEPQLVWPSLLCLSPLGSVTQKRGTQKLLHQDAKDKHRSQEKNNI